MLSAIGVQTDQSGSTREIANLLVVLIAFGRLQISPSPQAELLLVQPLAQLLLHLTTLTGMPAQPSQMDTAMAPVTADGHGQVAHLGLIQMQHADARLPTIQFGANSLCDYSNSYHF